MSKSLPKYEDLLIAWLKKNGYDGLYNPESRCRCFSTDIMRCGDNVEDVTECCAPGYQRTLEPELHEDEEDGKFMARTSRRTIGPEKLSEVRHCVNPRKSKFTVEQLHAAHEFEDVEDETDQLAVCAMVHALHHALPITDDGSTLEHLLSDYINTGDGYMANELVRIFEETIWEGKI